MSLTCCCITRCSSGRRRYPEQDRGRETEWLMGCCVGGGEEARCTPPYKPLERAGSFEMQAKKPQKTHRRAFTTIGDTGVQGEPRLVRSRGMRRDWSFEDLRSNNREP